MEEEFTTLKLIIEKGPRKGETLEFQPGSVIRIGRVVRGNTLPIKDAGISTKHLSIVSTTSPSFKWLITDLDSSNGTVLNDSTLTPLVPSDVRNGDVIKLGEFTSIKVSIEAAHVGGVAGRLRRNPKRGDSKAEGREDSELGLGFGGELGKVVENPRRRARPPKKEKVVKSESRDSVCEVVNVEESAPSEPKQGRRVSLEGVPLESVQNEVVDEKGEGCEKVEESLPKRQSEAVRGGVVEDGGPDLENMTLDDYFDYLAEYLPKQIIKETEEMILQMKQKAERVHEYVLEQRSDKEKGK